MPPGPRACRGRPLSEALAAAARSPAIRLAAASDCACVGCALPPSLPIARGCRLLSAASCGGTSGAVAVSAYVGIGGIGGIGTGAGSGAKAGAKAGGGAEGRPPLRRTEDVSRLIVRSGDDELRGDASPEPGTGVARDIEGSGGDSSVAAKLGGAGGAAATGGIGTGSAVLGVARVDGPEPGGSALRLPVTWGVVVAREQ